MEEDEWRKEIHVEAGKVKTRLSQLWHGPNRANLLALSIAAAGIVALIVIWVASSFSSGSGTTTSSDLTPAQSCTSTVIKLLADDGENGGNFLNYLIREYGMSSGEYQAYVRGRQVMMQYEYQSGWRTGLQQAMPTITQVCQQYYTPND